MNVASIGPQLGTCLGALVTLSGRREENPEKGEQAFVLLDQNPLGLLSKKCLAHPQVVTAGLSLMPRITNSVWGSFA